MKSLIVLLILNIMLWQTSFSQGAKDTINIESVEIVAKKIPAAYKTTKLDSSSISESTKLSDLLQEHSPIFIKTYGSGSLATVSFRGTGASHTSVLWNDISLNSPMNGQIDFSLYPTLFFDDAELHHGASGLIDGNGSLGGSVNLSNNPVFNKGLNGSVQQSIGSFSSYITSVKIGYSNKDWLTETQLYYNSSKNNFEYINIALQDKPVLTQNRAELQQYGFQQAIYRNLKNGNIGVRLWYFNSDRMLPSTMQTSLNDENQQDESLRTLIEWNGLIGNLKYKWVTAFLKDELIYSNTLSKINAKNNIYLINSKILTKYYLKYNFVLTNDASIKYEAVKADGYDAEHNRYNNTWLLGLSKNFKRLNIDAFNRFTQVGENTQLLSPNGGISYGFFKHNQLKLKANAGINYNYPTFNDLCWNPGGNPNLNPERAEMTEFGINYIQKVNQTLLEIEATGFYSYVYDWIIWQPTSTGIWSPSNLKEVENKGIELSLKLKTIINKTSVIANANYSNTFSTNLKGQSEFDNSIDKQLIYVPFHKMNYSIRLLYNTFSLSYNYSYTGKRFMSTDNNWYLPANFISNIGLSKKFKTSNNSNVSTSFKINNLFNQDYQSIAWRPMPGRNYLFTLTFQLN
ncbi:MAG: TonB-dependent receptor plug domain-containing protein [Flavobacteriales bacterium]|nr:TonB-dependent receptor plug domain-containing protein [Flavobacteriales bacterium]